MIKRLILIFSLLAIPQFLPATATAVDIFQRDVCDRYAGRPAAEVPSTCQDKNVGKDSNGNTQNPLFGPQGVLTRIINILTIVVGIVAVIMIILAGMKFITSGSNPQELSGARERIIYALVALVVAASAQILVRFILGSI